MAGSAVPRPMSNHHAAPFGRFVLKLSTAFAIAVFFGACATSNDTQPSSTSITQGAVTVATAESGQATDEGVFLRIAAPLDEARGYCLDIRGHLASVQLTSPLQVHTCKHGIWNHDGRFDQAALDSGILRMPYYELCLQAENTSIGARLLLAVCAETELQTWTLHGSGQIMLEAFPERCITVEDRPGRDAGGPEYRMKSVGLDACAPPASDRQVWTTEMPR